MSSACGVCGTESIDEIFTPDDDPIPVPTPGSAPTWCGPAGPAARTAEGLLPDRGAARCRGLRLRRLAGDRPRGRRSAQRGRQGARRASARHGGVRRRRPAVRQRPDRVRHRHQGSRRPGGRHRRRRRAVQPRPRPGRPRRRDGVRLHPRRAVRRLHPPGAQSPRRADGHGGVVAPKCRPGGNPSVFPCASCTPPTGTSAGRSTGKGCSTRSRRTSTTSSRSSRSEQVDAVARQR